MVKASGEFSIVDMSLQALECSKHFVTTSNMPQIKGISGNLSITNRLN
uniref:Uncharacterized protein n=1 Tax=Megaselia scalaris TaxID=36166 RepID=T1GRW9_MEGSC